MDLTVVFYASPHATIQQTSRPFFDGCKSLHKSPIPILVRLASSGMGVPTIFSLRCLTGYKRLSPFTGSPNSYINSDEERASANSLVCSAVDNASGFRALAVDVFHPITLNSDTISLGKVHS